jgi:hypothetical protein
MAGTDPAVVAVVHSQDDVRDIRNHLVQMDLPALARRPIDGVLLEGSLAAGVFESHHLRDFVQRIGKDDVDGI